MDRNQRWITITLNLRLSWKIITVLQLFGVPLDLPLNSAYHTYSQRFIMLIHFIEVLFNLSRFYSFYEVLCNLSSFIYS